MNTQKPSRSGSGASRPQNPNATKLLLAMAAVTACAALVVVGLLVYTVVTDRQKSATATPLAAASAFTPAIPIPTLTSTPSLVVTPTVTPTAELPTWTPAPTATQAITATAACGNRRPDGCARPDSCVHRDARTAQRYACAADRCADQAAGHEVARLWHAGLLVVAGRGGPTRPGDGPRRRLSLGQAGLFLARDRRAGQGQVRLDGHRPDRRAGREAEPEADRPPGQRADVGQRPGLPQ